MREKEKVNRISIRKIKKENGEKQNIKESVSWDTVLITEHTMEAVNCAKITYQRLLRNQWYVSILLLNKLKYANERIKRKILKQTDRQTRK